MSGLRLFCVIFICMDFSKCSGITNYDNEKNLIGEDERRGVIVKEDGVNDQKQSESTKRGLWLIAQHQQPSEYGSTGSGGGYHGSSGPGGYGYSDSAGGYGYSDSGGYGIGGSGYNYGTSGGGGYYKGPSFGHGYGYSGGGYSGGGHNFGHGGSGFGHSAHGEGGHEMSQEHGGYNKLALKKLLIPLAGLAILGAAAALSTNPVLLQLGSIQSGRRKRSVTSEASDVYPLNPWTKPDYEFT